MKSLTGIADYYFFSLNPFIRLAVIVLILLLVIYVSRKKRFLSPSGLLAAFFTGLIVLYISGLSGFCILLFFFLSSSILGKVLKTENSSIEKKGGERDAGQVFANSLTGSLCLILYFFSKNSLFLILYSASLAEAEADTFAGIFGMRSKEDPVSIITFTRVPKGISGGVSLLGFLGAFLGSFLMALLHTGTFSGSFYVLSAITLSAFLGAVLDSILGATVQVVYRKPDGSLTEKEGKDYVKYRGLSFMDNDMVNFTSTLFSALFCALLMML